MTLYDSSVLIDYLDGRKDAVEYVRDHHGDRALAPPLVLYEVYQGEVFKTGPTDFDAVDAALEWLVVVDETREFARAAAELQDAVAADGSPLAARDAFVAGAARALDERLAVADRDFDVDGIRDELDVDFL
ncbi:homolog to endonuclease VapC [Halobacterium hubeiense]|jgi:predicted nucleic acid-binding protein|uniref:Ribonuclease VapC n=2 Tax=Halobacterium TaxID=2239 RepID=A0A0U5CWB8_9EURY|nr:PIN domain-containing protein [Halobacterium hubeiense]CQH49963.1 homolog to endonuclease VapC [Halobacterium hubeiense]